MNHFLLKLLQRHFRYWAYTVQLHKTMSSLAGVTPKNQALPQAKRKLENVVQQKENAVSLYNARATPKCDKSKQSLKSTLNRSFVFNHTNTKSAHQVQKVKLQRVGEAQKNYKYFMMKELKLKKIKCKRHQVLLSKGFKGLKLHTYKRKKKRLIFI